jgi:hypothetical protein
MLYLSLWLSEKKNESNNETNIENEITPKKAIVSPAVIIVPAKFAVKLFSVTGRKKN